MCHRLDGESLTKFSYHYALCCDLELIYRFEIALHLFETEFYVKRFFFSI